MTGREKCKALRAIRRKIAKMNGIEYKPAVCRHKGPCLGVCPKCEQEAAYLMDELKRIEAAGQEIKTDPECIKQYNEVSQVEPNNDEVFVTLGMPEAPIELQEIEEESMGQATIGFAELEKPKPNCKKKK